MEILCLIAVSVFVILLLYFIIGLICIKFFPDTGKKNEGEFLKLIIEELDGQSFIVQGEVFDYVDSDFENWGLNREGQATSKIEVDIYEFEEDSTFEEDFTSISGDIDCSILTQSQIIDFCVKYLGYLIQQGETSFLTKEDFKKPAISDNLFVVTIAAPLSASGRRGLSAYVNPVDKSICGTHFIVVPKAE